MFGYRFEKKITLCNLLLNENFDRQSSQSLLTVWIRPRFVGQNETDADTLSLVSRVFAPSFCSEFLLRSFASNFCFEFLLRTPFRQIATVNTKTDDGPNAKKSPNAVTCLPIVCSKLLHNISLLLCNSGLETVLKQFLKQIFETFFRNSWHWFHFFAVSGFFSHTKIFFLFTSENDACDCSFNFVQINKYRYEF